MKILRIGMVALGLATIAIGGLIYLFGPVVTGDMFAAALSLVANTPPRIPGLGGANVDSELRFYAALWIAFGVMAIWVSGDLANRRGLARSMLGVFFAGGFGRALSYWIVGAPHPLFTVLMWLELVLPPALIALSLLDRKRAEA